MTIRTGISITAFAALSAMTSAACAGTSNVDRAAAATTSPTAQDQSTQVNDAEMTRKIRSELMSKNLSTRAKNVTIVTIDGMVTLKGTVPNANEKITIGEVAARLAPNVRNDLVVKQ